MANYSIHDTLAIRQMAPDVFESIHRPGGGLQKYAYGGFALGLACMVAHQNVTENHRLYTMTGNFLGPAQKDRRILCRVQNIRTTRTFTTKLILLSQTQDDGTERSCLSALVDFHLIEPASLLTFSKAPHLRYAMPDILPTTAQARAHMVIEGKMTKEQAKIHELQFDLTMSLFDTKPAPESVSGQNLFGFIKHLSTSQDHLHITEKTSAEWWRCRQPLRTRAEQASALAFKMDSAIAFLPLAQSHMFLDDAGASSSLDFAFRVFSNDIDINQWHLTEWKCITAAVGRNYCEAQLFDRDGIMIASMTQASIMRPKSSEIRGKL